MPLPETWTDVLSAPCFIVNMDDCKDRLDLASARIRDAGFTHVRRFPAVDARQKEPLAAAWATLGNPLFDPSDHEFTTYTGKQGCFLSHVLLLRRMVAQGLPYMTVMEDDVVFHTHWRALSGLYYESTDKRVDLVYFGSQIDHMMKGVVIKTPVFCTHSYLITREGAEKMLDLLIKSPSGVRTIDCMIIDEMKANFYKRKEIAFDWLVWSGVPFPDEAAFKDPKWARRNTGLVFQDPALGTFVREW